MSYDGMRWAPDRPPPPPSQTEPIATTWRSYVAELPAWGIVAGALAVSFWTQVDQVHRHGFAMWEALIWGTSTDAGTIACLFLAREGAHRGTPTWGAWLLSLACAFLSVQYNVVAGIDAGDWLAVEAHVWMPALALGVWYWLLHGRHRRWMLRRRAGVGVPQPVGPIATPPASDPAHSAPAGQLPDGRAVGVGSRASDERGGDRTSERNPLARVPARAAVRRLLKRHGNELTAKRIVERTGVSMSRARALLREERGLHVIHASQSAEERATAEAER